MYSFLLTLPYQAAIEAAIIARKKAALLEKYGGGVGKDSKLAEAVATEPATAK
jgi:hypothetical protein